VIYRWRIRLRILRWYRALLVLESGLSQNVTSEKREELLDRIDQIERTVNHMKVPASFADQFYSLRSHIAIVRARLMSSTN
jgi:CII-binding regulator of phage lambda lysogenization HflD